MMMYRTVILFLFSLLLAGCVSQQAMFIPLTERSYPPRPADFEIAVFRDRLPDRSFERIARLNVHIEKTHFLGSDVDKAIDQLVEQARASGADAIIEVEVDRSGLNETRILNVSGVAIVFTD